MRATGIVRRIDDLGRVVIPKEIRRTMHIRVGDPLEIYTAKDGELIFKKYSPIGELSDFAAHICDSLKKSTDRIAIVCDRDSIIAVAGGTKSELSDKNVSSELSEIMENRSPYRDGSETRIPAVDNGSYFLSTASPILSEGDVLGCVALISKEDSTPATELEYTLVQTIAYFLGRQMES